MGSLGDLAAALRRAQAEIDGHGAIDCAREAAPKYLDLLKANTPVRSGELRGSERVDSVSGGGRSARAVIGAHTIYAAFREVGGDIYPHDRSRGGWVGAPRVINGVRYGHHTLHWGGEPGVFATHVFQVGSYYFSRTNQEAGPVIAEACRTAIGRIFRESGL